MKFRCLPIDVDDCRRESCPPPTSTSVSLATGEECKLPDCRVNMKTRPGRTLSKKSDYLALEAFEHVGTLIATSSSSSADVDELKLLNLLARPNFRSRDRYDYRISTSRGLVIDIFTKVDWLDHDDIIDIKHLDATFVVTLLDDFR